MDAVVKDLVSRKDEIKKELELLFKTNLKIVDWDVPEADDDEAAKILVDILQEGLDKIKQDVKNRVYRDY